LDATIASYPDQQHVGRRFAAAVRGLRRDRRHLSCHPACTAAVASRLCVVVGSLLARLRWCHRGRLHRAVGALSRLRLGTATDDRVMEENPVKTFLKLTFPLQPGKGRADLQRQRNYQQR